VGGGRKAEYTLDPASIWCNAARLRDLEVEGFSNEYMRWDVSMSKHAHSFVEGYEGLVAFGLSRKTDEESLICYLQKFSDDDLIKRLAPRLSDDEINQLFDLMSRLMRKYLADEEYHKYFLKDEGH
jgi:hypothetical protein